MKKLILLGLLVTLCVTSGSAKPFSGSKAVRTARMIYDTQKVSFPSAHASTLLETPKGLLAAWFGGKEEGDKDVCIYLTACRKGDWSIPVLVANGIENGIHYPCWNPVLMKKDNNDIVLFYKVGPNPRTWWGMYKISHDEGLTWSEGVKLPEHYLGPIKDKGVRLPDGQWLYPSSFETTKSWNIYLESSDQALKEWKHIPIDNQQLQSIQPTLLFYPEGKMQLLCRSKNQHINTAWSTDQGKTWTALSPTELPNNNSGIDAVTLKDGRQFLVFNPQTKGRFKLATAISKDGIHWEAVALLEDNPDPKAEYSYPAVIQTGDGNIHITYTWHRTCIKEVIIKPSKIKSRPMLDGQWPEQEK